MKRIFFLLLFFSALVFPKLCAAQLATGCTAADSMARAWNAQLPASASVTFITNENCLILMTCPNSLKVISYDLVLKYKGNVICNPFQGNIIRQGYLSKGEIYLENIKAASSDGKVIKLKPVSFVY